MPLKKQLKVRDDLAAAKEMAGVGTNIRWDLIIEDAAKTSCGIKANAAAMKKANAAADCSTSASGSGRGEVDEESSNDDSSDSGKEAASQIITAKLPPWRRQSPSATVASPQSIASPSDDQAPSAAVVPSPRWRRGGAEEVHVPVPDTRVYHLTTMLAVFSMMRDASVEVVEAVMEDDESHVSDSDEDCSTKSTTTTEDEDEDEENLATAVHTGAPCGLPPGLGTRCADSDNLWDSYQ